MTSISDLPGEKELVENRRLRLERILQIAAHDFELHFEFGQRDLIGAGQIVLKAQPAMVENAGFARLKAEALHLLAHYLVDSRAWAEAALREQAQGKPHFAAFWHALEDARMENGFVRRWPGAEKYFRLRLPPNLGGALMRRMPLTRQAELGLYLLGRNIQGARFSGEIHRLLAELAPAIRQAAAGDSPADSYRLALDIYPRLAPLTARLVNDPHQQTDALQQPVDADQANGDMQAATPEREEPLGEPPEGTAEIEIDEELFSLEFSGRRQEFPEWYRPGSAPWFERGLGRKEIHPSALRTSRQTIVPPPSGDLEAYRQLRAEMRHEVGFLTHRLTNLLREEAYLRYAGYYRSGKLNMAKLWKQRIGNYRLFQRSVTASSHTIAFSLLVDESASMQGQGKYLMATKAAVLLGETLDVLGAPLEIIGYSTSEYEARAALLLGLTPAYQYRSMRCAPLEHRIYKHFDEPYHAVRIRLTGIEPRHNNWDEEHLSFAFQRLQQRPERRKVLIVIGDGQPNGDASYLIDTVKRIESLGCEVIAIGITGGIGADFVKQIYTNAIVVADFRQMTQEMLTILTREYHTGAYSPA